MGLRFMIGEPHREYLTFTSVSNYTDRFHWKVISSGLLVMTTKKMFVKFTVRLGSNCLTTDRQTAAIRKCVYIYLWGIMPRVSVFRQYLLKNDQIWRIPLFQMVITCVKCPEKKRFLRQPFIAEIDLSPKM